VTGVRKTVSAILAAAFLATACDVFIVKNDIEQLKELEKGTYILKKDFNVDGKILKKGETVKLKISTAKEWVKVHAYSTKVDELKAERVLILFLYDEKFKDKKFSRDYFNEQLNAVAAAR
jgi:type II secretion system-associated lipoprotein